MQLTAWIPTNLGVSGQPSSWSRDKVDSIIQGAGHSSWLLWYWNIKPLTLMTEGAISSGLPPANTIVATYPDKYLVVSLVGYLLGAVLSDLFSILILSWVNMGYTESR